MTEHWTEEEHGEFADAVDDTTNLRHARTTAGPEAALAESRVDLIDLIRNGIPDPEYVPGGEPWLRKGKRYLIPAPAGTGKSLAALIVAVTTVEHGGSAIILDVENGADEYARRLEAILTARDQDGTLTHACQQRLSYHTWPSLRLDWTADEWAIAIAGADLVIFDSSRLMLSSVGLAEDSNDEYSQFITAIVMPLAKAGTTTILLDNTGHGDKDRARGASTKSDLNEVVYMLEVVKGEEFDRDTAGQLRLKRTRGRFAGLPDELRMHVGGNTYTAPTEAKPAADTGERQPQRLTNLMEKVSRIVENEPGIVLTHIFQGIDSRHVHVRAATQTLLDEGYIERQTDGNAKRHHSIQPYREANDNTPTSPPVPTCPTPVPDSTKEDLSTCPPLKGQGTSPNPTGHNPPVPDR